MKKKEILLLCLFVFGAVSIGIPTQSYAISLDDDEEDREDVGDYLQSAKSAAKSENFSQAQKLLKKAKSHGVLFDDVKEVQNYIAQKKQAYEDRLERERVARLERERQRASSHSSSSSSYGVSVCIPSIPRTSESSECRASSASASYENATVQLTKNLIGGCYDLKVYTGRGVGVGNTCGGLNSGWSVNVNGTGGYANGVSNAVAWILQRM